MNRRLRVALALLGPFLLIVAAYLAAATREIELPGIYMDAVNPDYLVVRWLNPAAKWIPSWLAPGNDILQRYPLLVGLHHGSLQLWLGAPLFWMFGTTVVGLRLTHAMFALAVLAVWYSLQRRAGLSPAWAAAFGVALAVDPSFVYAFRSQSYITMAPAALLMLALIALLRARICGGWPRALWLAGCGLLVGLACWGYFIYSFFVPALLVAVWLLPAGPGTRLSRPMQLLSLGAGMLVGVAPYAVGFWLMKDVLGSTDAAIRHLLLVQPRLGIAESSVSMAARLVHAEEMLRAMIGNAWHHALMFASWTATPGAALKYFLLIGLPVLLWLVAEWRRCATPLLRMLMGLQVSFVCGALFFGTRINGHHYTPFVPLGYAGLAAAMGIFVDGGRRWQRPTGVVAGAVVAALLAINLVGNAREIEALRRTGGIGNYSDAINRLGADLLAGDHQRAADPARLGPLHADGIPDPREHGNAKPRGLRPGAEAAFAKARMSSSA